MEHNADWQKFTESGDPLAYMEYRHNLKKPVSFKRKDENI